MRKFGWQSHPKMLTPSTILLEYSERFIFGRPQKWPRGFVGQPESTKTALIELRVEEHHLREAKMMYLNSQFDQSC
eukprot:gene25896-biopygen11452